MSDHEFAALHETAGGYQLRLERLFPQSVETVWSALIDSDERANWLASGPIELRKGAPFRLTWTNTGDEMESTVIAVYPPRLLEFYWHQERSSDSVIRWELSPEAGGTRFVLTHTLPVLDEGPDTLSGWHTHIEMLGQFLRNEPSPWNWARWRELKAHYIEALQAEGHVLPSPGRTFDDTGHEIVPAEPANAGK
jgi:uncharacterized protein YndB with AHSA1/START domain